MEDYHSYHRNRGYACGDIKHSLQRLGLSHAAAKSHLKACFDIPLCCNYVINLSRAQPSWSKRPYFSISNINSIFFYLVYFYFIFLLYIIFLFVCPALVHVGCCADDSPPCLVVHSVQVQSRNRCIVMMASGPC